jgi:methyl-accepting chemotaxis protein
LIKADKNSLDIEEQIIRLRILYTFCILTGVGALIGTLFTITNFQALLPGGLAVICAASYWLARNGQQSIAAWLITVPNAAIMALLCWNHGTLTPRFILFLIPIALAAVLLNRLAVVILTSAILVFITFMFVSQNLLGWRPGPPEELSDALQFSNLSMLIVVLPLVVALFVIPTRQQANILKKRNLQLEEALTQIKDQQTANLQTSYHVIELAQNLNRTANEQMEGSSVQLSSTNQIETSLRELSEAASNIANVAGIADRAVEQAKQKSVEAEHISRLSLEQASSGLNAIGNALQFSEEIAHSYQQLSANITEMNAKVLKVQPVLTIIDGIAKETHLLALNAAIEAVGAGEAGNRFNVVAQEVKTLATQVSKAGKQVSATIEEILQSMQQVVNMAQGGYSRFEAVEKVTLETEAAISQIRTLIENSQSQATFIKNSIAEVEEAAKAIATTTYQQKSATAEVSLSLSHLAALAQQNATTGVLLSTLADNLQTVSNKLTQSDIISSGEREPVLAARVGGK